MEKLPRIQSIERIPRQCFPYLFCLKNQYNANDQIGELSSLFMAEIVESVKFPRFVAENM